MNPREKKPTFPALAALEKEAQACQRSLARYDDPADPGQQRAREILTELAQRCRTTIDVLRTDPTLATEPVTSTRLRSVDLLIESARQLRALVRIAALDNHHLDRLPRAQRWEEAEGLCARALFLADEHIPATVPRPDHATVAGSHAISAERLAAQYDVLREAAAAIRAMLPAAAAVPHPHPRVAELADLAAQLQRHAEALKVVRHNENPVARATS